MDRLRKLLTDQQRKHCEFYHLQKGVRNSNGISLDSNMNMLGQTIRTKDLD